VSLAAQPDEREDAIELYVSRPGRGTLARALTPARRSGNPLQRVASAALRGGLTTWVHVGMLVRRMRGRTDPLEGLDRADTFGALCRLAQAAVDGAPVQAPAELDRTAHVRVLATRHDAEVAMERLEEVLRPYAVAGTVTRSGRAVIAWFAIRHLIAVRADGYALQVVHLSPDDGPSQVSLMLPRTAEDGERRFTSRRARRRAERAERADVAALSPGTPTAPHRDLPLQDYLDACTEQLGRALLLEPVVASLAWTPEPTGDGGVAVAGTVPAAVSDEMVLRMAAEAVVQLGDRDPERAGVPLGGTEPEGDLLVRRWGLGPAQAYVLSVAARTGDRRRPTQVLIHVGPVEPPSVEAPAREAVHEPPRSGPAVDDARALIMLPLWWHSADARCDGNDVILYEMPFRGRRLRIRANDYPAEPMYTLLVGDPGAEVAAVDLEDWPPSWTRPRA
jgi:hypothetical protein